MIHTELCSELVFYLTTLGKRLLCFNNVSLVNYWSEVRICEYVSNFPQRLCGVERSFSRKWISFTIFLIQLRGHSLWTRELTACRRNMEVRLIVLTTVSWVNFYRTSECCILQSRSEPVDCCDVADKSTPWVCGDEPISCSLCTGVINKVSLSENYWKHGLSLSCVKPSGLDEEVWNLNHLKN